MEISTSRYLNRTIRLYKIHIGLFLYLIIGTSLKRVFFPEQNDLLDLLIGIPALAFLMIVPFGLWNSIKSLRRKEGKSKARLLYFIGFLFSFLIFMFMMFVLISDISKLF